MKRNLGILLNSVRAFFQVVFIRREKWNEMIVGNYMPVYVNKKGEVLYCRPDWIDELYDQIEEG